MPTKIEKDAVTGRDTTGHEWDGLKELNTPLPKWWLYVFIACIIWAVILFILYPSFPLGRTYLHGVLGYSQRDAVDREVADAQAALSGPMSRIAAEPFAEIARDPALLATAETAGRAAFANNCQPCHGPSGQGRPGYPVLADDDWLWGGAPDEIFRTVTHGIRSGDPRTRGMIMPNFGSDQILTADEIGKVADYVLSLSGQAPAHADLATGKQIFADNCTACHGAAGEGSQKLGAPRLSDQIWLYSGDRNAVIQQISHPRLGVMPAWGPRLDPATIKSLVLYVHSLGGGQ